jgi:VWFA-related protein
MKRYWSAVGVLAAVGTLGAQTPTPPQQDPRFRVEIELVTTDVIFRDAKGQFVSDIKRDEFEVYEDGVKQDLSSMTLVYGGRVTNLLAPPPPVIEGIVLPATRAQNTTSGRVLLFVIDDHHLDVHKTPVIRDLFKQIGRNLLHEGDMFGMVSTGLSNIAVDLTYDRALFNSSIDKITGGGLSALDIIQGQTGAQGPIEVRHRAQVAFETINELISKLEKIRDRRKVVVHVSNGYDFSPYLLARSGDTAVSPFAQNNISRSTAAETAKNALDEGNQAPRQDPNSLGNVNEQWSDARLAQELQYMTEAANRANATFYTIDPRGVVAGADVGDNVNPREYQAYVTKTQDTLRVIAQQTGGFAVVNQNEFESALKRIDAEASDYYVLGYYAKNVDPTRREHTIEIKVNRPGVTVWNRKSYVRK